MAHDPRPKTPPRRTLHLALQGGGAQGAYTWGVLDRLLEEDSIGIGRISGSSAGALNGAALATGLALGGRDGARKHLAMLWEQIAQAGAPMGFLMLPWRKPGMGLWDDLLPLWSPWQTNPMGMAPLRAILNTVASEAVLRRADAAPALFVNAVNVHTGAARVFGPADISMDALAASACAPLSYQAVEIEGQAYWDGSYAANPALSPLYEGGTGGDILLVELTPRHRAETPLSAKDIVNRMNEIASIQGLVAELQALHDTRRKAAGAAVRMHVLSMADQPAGTLAAEPSIKRTVSRELFEVLRQDGRRACDAWLADHGHQIGRADSVDIAARYLQPRAGSPAAKKQVKTAASA